MLIISYDIESNKLRSKFAKALESLGATRLQYSVFEAHNSTRVLENLRLMIREEFGPKFTGADSVVVFVVNEDKTERFGNAVHRENDLNFF